MTISNETKSRKLVDICGIGNEKTVLSHRQMAAYGAYLAKTIQSMQTAVRVHERKLQELGVTLPSTIGSILPDYLDVRNKVVIETEHVAVDPLIAGDTVELDLDQFIQICDNRPPLCWSNFVGTTDGAAQLTGVTKEALLGLADELYEVSTEASQAVRDYVETNYPKQWDVTFTHLIEQSMTITVEAATEEQARTKVSQEGISATEEYADNIDREDGDVHDTCWHIHSVELNEDDE